MYVPPNHTVVRPYSRDVPSGSLKDVTCDYPSFYHSETVLCPVDEVRHCRIVCWASTHYLIKCVGGER